MMKSLYFNEEHALFRQSVSDFVTKEVLPHVNDWETKRQIPKKVWEKMGDLGFLGLMYPEKYGGMDAYLTL